MSVLDEIEATLTAGERVAVNVSVDGFHASEHNLFPSAPRVVLTDRRLVLFSRRGAFKKRYEEEASWSLRDFTRRVNSNQGTALGPFMYFLTLFTTGGETVSAAFRTEGQRDEFKDLVSQVIAVANGW